MATATVRRGGRIRLRFFAGRIAAVVRTGLEAWRIYGAWPNNGKWRPEMGCVWPIPQENVQAALRQTRDNLAGMAEAERDLMERIGYKETLQAWHNAYMGGAQFVESCAKNLGVYIGHYKEVEQDE